jgi:hypothetical protein
MTKQQELNIVHSTLRSWFRHVNEDDQQRIKAILINRYLVESFTEEPFYSANLAGWKHEAVKQLKRLMRNYKDIKIATKKRDRAIGYLRIATALILCSNEVVKDER